MCNMFKNIYTIVGASRESLPQATQSGIEATTR
jgi:hypothetical protein